MDGTYHIYLLTPLGKKDGIITLKTNMGELSGTLNVMNNETVLKNGKVFGNTFEFTGTIKTGLGMIEYSATGTVDGDTIKAAVKTNFGNLQMSGVKSK